MLYTTCYKVRFEQKENDKFSQTGERKNNHKVAHIRFVQAGFFLYSGSSKFHSQSASLLRPNLGVHEPCEGWFEAFFLLVRPLVDRNVASQNGLACCVWRVSAKL